MARSASVSHIKWAFYDAYNADDKESMADWFETLHHHYKNRGKRIRKLLRKNGE